MSEHEKNAICVLHGGSVPVIGMQQPAAEETETAEMTAAAESTQETSGVLVIEDAGEDKNKTISVRIVDSSNRRFRGARRRRSAASTLRGRWPEMRKS